MQFFTKVVAAVALATFVSATPVEERQLSGLPSVVCLMDPLAGIASSLPAGTSIVTCATGETCTELDIPVIGSLLPIGTCVDSTD